MASTSVFEAPGTARIEEIALLPPSRDRQHPVSRRMVEFLNNLCLHFGGPAVDNLNKTL